MHRDFLWTLQLFPANRKCSSFLSVLWLLLLTSCLELSEQSRHTDQKSCSNFCYQIFRFTMSCNSPPHYFVAVSVKVAYPPFAFAPLLNNVRLCALSAHAVKHAADQTRGEVGVDGVLEWITTVLLVNHWWKTKAFFFFCYIPQTLIPVYFGQQNKISLFSGLAEVGGHSWS